MNRTIKDATVKRCHYDSHDQLRSHLADFLDAYNFARRLKTLSGLTPYEYVCKIWTSDPDRFIVDPIHQRPGLNNYWPIGSEPDLRGWLGRLRAAGGGTALPLVETRAAPLVFRRWRPGDRMTRGHWNIPVPTEDAGIVTPDVTIAPLVGWDGAGYRLGYGGGYFDRTLAALSPRPFVIGVGFEVARLATIYPQPHDVPMDAIVTEAGLRMIRER